MRSRIAPSLVGMLIVSACATCAPVSAQQDCPDPVWPPVYAYIYGQAGWWVQQL